MAMPTENLKLRAFSLVNGAWQFRWYGLGVAWLLCAIGWLGIALIPNSYRSTARAYIDTDGLLRPLLHGLAVPTNPDQQIAMMLQTLLTTPNVKRVVEMTDPHAASMSPEQMHAAVAHIQKNVQLQHLDQGHLFRISYSGDTPADAQQVTQALLSVLVDSHIGGVRQDSDDVRSFLDNQIAQYEKKLKEADARRANFKATHLDFFAAAPTSDGGATVSDPVSSAQAALAAAQNAVIEAKARRDAARAELGSVPATQSFGAGGTSQLAQAEARLAELKTQFKDNYPDVVAEKRLIARLKAGGASSTTGGDTTEIANPMYMQMRGQVAAEDANVRVAEENLKSAKDQLAKAKKNAVEAIAVQRQYQDLDRDYQVIHRNYEQLVERREQAQISQAASDAGSSFVFRVVDPPQAPERPSAPNRLLLNALVLVAAIGLGCGFAFLLSQLSGRILTLDEVAEAFALPIIGAVTMVETARDVARRRRAAAIFALCLLALLVSYAGILLAYHTSTDASSGLLA